MPDSQRMDRQIERAIVFLTFQIQRTGKNPKPVILHSIRVALSLYDRGYAEEVVVAAALHDLLEDSDTTLPQIERKFGPEVARLVRANTFDERIEDAVERDREMLERCRNAGGSALVIKVADILDNSRRWRLTPGDALSERLLRKVELCLDLSEDDLKEERIRADLNRERERLQVDMGLP